MIEIERRSIYLGVNTRNEYNRIFDLLSQNTALSDEQRRELKIVEIDKDKVQNVDINVQKVRNSVHAYWLIATGRFTDQFHMSLMLNFITKFN